MKPLWMTWARRGDGKGCFGPLAFIFRLIPNIKSITRDQNKLIKIFKCGWNFYLRIKIS